MSCNDATSFPSTIDSIKIRWTHLAQCATLQPYVVWCSDRRARSVGCLSYCACGAYPDSCSRLMSAGCGRFQTPFVASGAGPRMSSSSFCRPKRVWRNFCTPICSLAPCTTQWTSSSTEALHLGQAPNSEAHSFEILAASQHDSHDSTVEVLKLRGRMQTVRC